MNVGRAAGLAFAAFLCIAVGILCVVALRQGGVGRAAAGERQIALADYVGEERCLSCHVEQGSFRGTAHARSSRPATASAIAGSFSPGSNVLRTSNPDLYFRMDSTASGYYQTAVVGSPSDPETMSGRFDLVIGSGRKGQSYLHWKEGGHLFQLPVSYWTELDRWVNSPGYRDGLPNFGGPVHPRCLECHATFFQPLAGSLTPNRYDTTGMVLGISCEKCHGPGREHVERQASWSGWPRGSAIVNPARLPRQRQLEVCALCHGGIGVPVAPSFSYVPGEPLGAYVHLGEPEPDQPVDVHGNQVALLAASACFKASEMTCSTCHDVHRTQRSPAAFSASCLGCHEARQCGRFPTDGHSITQRCVDCHMPALPSSTIVSTVEGERAQPRVRSHWIKVYPHLDTP